jgi:hypothetical protein
MTDVRVQVAEWTCECGRVELAGRTCCNCGKAEPVEVTDVPVGGPLDLEHVDGWVCGTGLDEPEHAHMTDVFESREQAIKHAPDELGLPIGDGFQTAYLRHVKESMPNQLSAEYSCDQAENDEWGEGVMEQWQDKVFGKQEDSNERTPLVDLQERLDKVWDEWTEAHKLEVTLFYLDDVEHHTIEACKRVILVDRRPEDAGIVEVGCVRPQFHDGLCSHIDTE